MRLFSKYVRVALLLVFILIVVFPIAWMALSSFKTTSEIYDDPWSMPSKLSERRSSIALAASELNEQIAALPPAFPSQVEEARNVAAAFIAMSEDPVVRQREDGEVVFDEPGGPINRIRIFAPELRTAGNYIGRTQRMARNLNAYADRTEQGQDTTELAERLDKDFLKIRGELQEVADTASSKAAQGVFGNYIEAWSTTKIGSAFFNSLIVSFGTMIVLIPIASMAAYVLAKYKFRGSNTLFMLFLGGMMFPQFLVIVPLFLQMTGMGLDDNLFGLTIVYIAFSLPFTIFVLTGFFHQLPDELAEAAMLDGCGHQATFWRIMMPLAKPGLVVVTIFDVIGLWNEYNLSLILMRTPDRYTLPKALDSLQMTSQYLGDTGALMAAMVIVILPVLVVYWLLKEKIHEAMLAGAIKG